MALVPTRMAGPLQHLTTHEASEGLHLGRLSLLEALRCNGNVPNVMCQVVRIGLSYHQRPSECLIGPYLITKCVPRAQIYGKNTFHVIQNVFLRSMMPYRAIWDYP